MAALQDNKRKTAARLSKYFLKEKWGSYRGDQLKVPIRLLQHNVATLSNMDSTTNVLKENVVPFSY